MGPWKMAFSQVWAAVSKQCLSASACRGGRMKFRMLTGNDISTSLLAVVTKGCLHTSSYPWWWIKSRMVVENDHQGVSSYQGLWMMVGGTQDGK